MKPQDQTVFGAKTGNCFAACVASILHLPIDEVPNFCGDNPEGPQWWIVFLDWLEKRGHQAIYFDFEEGPVTWKTFEQVIPINQYWITTGKSPRGDFLHATIRKGYNKMTHDPHPSRDGIVGNPTDGIIIVPGIPNV